MKKIGICCIFIFIDTVRVGISAYLRTEYYEGKLENSPVVI